MLSTHNQESGRWDMQRSLEGLLVSPCPISFERPNVSFQTEKGPPTSTKPTLPVESLKALPFSHDIHKEFARVAHGFLERLTAPSQLRRDGAEFAHGGPARWPACPIDFGAQLREVVEWGDSWRPVRMVAAGTPVAGCGRGMAAVAELAGRPLPPQGAAPSPAPGGMI